jgi:hypothetical protein
MFDQVFRNCDLSNSKQLNGAAVKDLFEQTALERKTLSEVTIAPAYPPYHSFHSVPLSPLHCHSTSFNN